MGKSIILITDMYGSFMTKVPSNPYKSGLNLDDLCNLLKKYNYNIEIKRFVDFQFFDNYSDKIILYTSIEDPNGYYRSYIDDVLFGLEQAGAILIPKYKFFKAHENKVFMEILRNLIFPTENGIKSYKFGSSSDFFCINELIRYPAVIKKSSGSGSKGVYLAKSYKNSIKYVLQASNTYNYVSQIKDFLLAQKKRIQGVKYINRVNLYRKKFIVQNFITDLPNDYKVLIFYDKYYLLKRYNRPNDFKASGSGNFLIIDESDSSPTQILDECENWFKRFKVPYASFDVAYNGNEVYLLEFQFVSFGTYTQTSAKYYFTKIQNKWEKVKKTISLEEVYADSIAQYINEMITDLQ